MSRSIRSSIPSFVSHSAQSEAWIFAWRRLPAALLCISETRKMDTNQWEVGTLMRHTYPKESDFVVVATRKRIALSRTKVLHRESLNTMIRQVAIAVSYKDVIAEYGARAGRTRPFGGIGKHRQFVRIGGSWPKTGTAIMPDIIRRVASAKPGAVAFFIVFHSPLLA